MEGIAIGVATVLAAPPIVALAVMVVRRGRRIRAIEAQLAGLTEVEIVLARARAEREPTGPGRRRHLRALGLIPAAGMFAWRTLHRPAVAGAATTALLAAALTSGAHDPAREPELLPPAAGQGQVGPAAAAPTPTTAADRRTIVLPAAVDIADDIPALETAAPVTTTTTAAAGRTTTTTPPTTTTTLAEDCPVEATVLDLSLDVC